MAAFPGAIPTFAGFTSTHTLAADNHAAQHNLEQAEIVQIATKLGIGAATPAAGTFLASDSDGESVWRAIQVGDFTALIDTVLNATYPVGSIYTNSSDPTNPATLLGFGTWIAFGAGKVPVGIDAGQAEFDTAEETGGAKTHTLTAAEMPTHSHTENAALYADVAVTSGTNYFTNNGTTRWNNATAGAGFGARAALSTGTAGSGGAHNNLQPYIVVYMWKRTA